MRDGRPNLYEHRSDVHRFINLGGGGLTVADTRIWRASFSHPPTQRRPCRLVGGLSAPRREFDPSLVHVVFVVTKVPLGLAYLLVFRVFPAALCVLLKIYILGDGQSCKQYKFWNYSKKKFSLWLYCWRCRIVTHSHHLVVVITLP